VSVHPYQWINFRAPGLHKHIEREKNRIESSMTYGSGRAVRISRENEQKAALHGFPIVIVNNY
jgi:hypothetical protein